MFTPIGLQCEILNCVHGTNKLQNAAPIERIGSVSAALVLLMNNLCRVWWQKFDLHTIIQQIINVASGVVYSGVVC